MIQFSGTELILLILLIFSSPSPSPFPEIASYISTLGRTYRVEVTKMNERWIEERGRKVGREGGYYEQIKHPVQDDEEGILASLSLGESKHNI